MVNDYINEFKKNGINLDYNIDNYFFNLEMHPKDEFGDYDFETPQALDLELIDNHLSRLAAGEEVKIPYYDFKTGTQYPDRTPPFSKSAPFQPPEGSADDA